MSSRNGSSSDRLKAARKRRLIRWGVWTLVVSLVLLGAAAWLASRAATIQGELHSSTSLLPTLKAQIAANDTDGATSTVNALVAHTGSARDAASDPFWSAAGALPWLGPNFRATSEVATTADDVARLGALPLVGAYKSLKWADLTPSSAGADLSPLRAAAPKVEAAAYAVRESLQRLNGINAEDLLSEIASPVKEARAELSALSHDLDSAADAAKLAPGMLGAESPRHYLLLMQNNAESRATGGIPGALAVLTVDNGKLTLDSQTSATALGTFVPPVKIDAEQQAIYSARVGKYMQDVNLTPDFATSAATALAMWEKHSGERLDGVLSIDPIALSYMLDATGPVQITDPLVRKIGSNLPAELTSTNVVQTLLSDAYAKIDEPKLQDVYFAGTAKEIFGALSSGKTEPKKLIDSLSKGVEERRILLWSASPEEQTTIGRYPLGGLTSGAAISPAQFGVYFNDGTGAKMDFWVKRTVQVTKDCTRDGYREITLKVTSTNTAPADAATTLPAYVTGGGVFGVPAGTVQTNVVTYGPAQSNIDTVVKDGNKIPFAAQRHGQRAVGSSTVRLAPGESSTLEFNFGHIVQEAKSKIVVTPTTQAVKDVIRESTLSTCE